MFPYGTTAQYEIHKFLSCWENFNWLRGILSLFFGAMLSCNIFIFILTNSKGSQMRERVRSVSLLPNYSAHTTQWISTEQTPASFNFYPLNIFQLDGCFPSVFQQIPPTPINIFQLRGAGTCTLPNETQNHQPIQESQEPGQTHPNCLEFPRRWIGTRGLCWYQYASSLKSLDKGEKFPLGPFMVIKTMD